MQTEHLLLILILVIPLALVFANRLRLDLAALLMACLLGVLQFAGFSMLGPTNSPQDSIKAIAGFSQSVVISLISLFILSRGLDNSGITRWIAQQIVRVGGNKTSRLIVLFASITAFSSLFMNNLAAGALILPSAMEASRRTGIKPSKLLIPVAYGSLLGGTATYFTTANIIMSDLLKIANPPQAPLKILDFAPVGGLITIVGILFFWLLGDKLLPSLEPVKTNKQARLFSNQLEDIYQLEERLWAAKISPKARIIGLSLEETEIGRTWGISVAAILREPNELILPSAALNIRGTDQLILIGKLEHISQLKILGLEIQPLEEHNFFSKRGIGIAEVIVAPHSSLEGRTIKELDIRHQFGVNVIALKRQSHRYRTDVGSLCLSFGDSLLVLGTHKQIQALETNLDVIVLEPSTDHIVINKRNAIISITITLASIIASIAGMPVFLSVLFGAVILLLFKVVDLEEAYRTIEWQAIFLIAGMYAVSLALVQTGLANLLGQKLLPLLIPFGSLGIAGGAYLLTALLTQFMGGQVSALVTGPVVLSAAIALGVNPQAVAIATAIGCSASFFTPMAHPVNILMIAPANYRFSDFFRIGWILTVICFLVLLVGLKLFWGL